MAPIIGVIQQSHAAYGSNKVPPEISICFPHSFAKSISPQKMFTAPRTPRAPMKGFENEDSTGIRRPNKEMMEIKVPMPIIMPGRYLPVFVDALETSRASTPVVSFRRGSSFGLRAGGETTISFLFLFSDTSPTDKHRSEWLKNLGCTRSNV